MLVPTALPEHSPSLSAHYRPNQKQQPEMSAKHTEEFHSMRHNGPAQRYASAKTCFALTPAYASGWHHQEADTVIPLMPALSCSDGRESAQSLNGSMTTFSYESSLSIGHGIMNNGLTCTNSTMHKNSTIAEAGYGTEDSVLKTEQLKNSAKITASQSATCQNPRSARNKTPNILTTSTISTSCQKPWEFHGKSLKTLHLRQQQLYRFRMEFSGTNSHPGREEEIEIPARN